MRFVILRIGFARPLSDDCGLYRPIGIWSVWVGGDPLSVVIRGGLFRPHRRKLTTRITSRISKSLFLNTNPIAPRIVVGGLRFGFPGKLNTIGSSVFRRPSLLPPFSETTTSLPPPQNTQTNTHPHTPSHTAATFDPNYSAYRSFLSSAARPRQCATVVSADNRPSKSPCDFHFGGDRSDTGPLLVSRLLYFLTPISAFGHGWH